MGKQALLVLILIIVVAAAWMAVVQKESSETAVEAGTPEPQTVEQTDRSPGMLRGVDSNDIISEPEPAPAGMAGSPDPASTSGPSTGLDRSIQIPPEGLPGDASPAMGPAPEASDTGVMGPAPEAGDTGIIGPAPEADAVIMESPAPEFGQPTEQGLPPEASQTP